MTLRTEGYAGESATCYKTRGTRIGDAVGNGDAGQAAVIEERKVRDAGHRQAVRYRGSQLTPPLKPVMVIAPLLVVSIALASPQAAFGAGRRQMHQVLFGFHFLIVSNGPFYDPDPIKFLLLSERLPNFERVCRFPKTRQQFPVLHWSE